MKEGLDSSNVPTLAQVLAARAAGRVIWSGYLATRANVGLYAPWPDSAWAIVKQAGGMPLAYCSGWDDPVALKAKAAALGVRLCLDDETGIRPDGAWVQPFLDASSAGLYGNAQYHVGRSAPFHVLAAYPTSGDPTDSSWWAQTARPATPCGWQWCGTHTEFGINVDSTWFDDWFATGGDFMALTDAQQSDMFAYTKDADANTQRIQSALTGPDGSLVNVASIATELGTAISKISAPTIDINALADAIVAKLPPPAAPVTLPAPTQAVKDWFTSLLHALGWG